MNIREELLREKVFTKEQAANITNYVLRAPARFSELMQFFFCDEYRLAQRAAWIASFVFTLNPLLLNPYIKDFVAQLKRKDVHDAVIRNSVRILQQVEIPESEHGELMNSCFDLIALPSTPVAIKAFSLNTLFNLSKLYPEIKNELKLIIEERWNNETAAFKSRGKNILNELSKKQSEASQKK